MENLDVKLQITIQRLEHWKYALAQHKASYQREECNLTRYQKNVTLDNIRKNIDAQIVEINTLELQLANALRPSSFSTRNSRVSLVGAAS